MEQTVLPLSMRFVDVFDSVYPDPNCLKVRKCYEEKQQSSKLWTKAMNQVFDRMAEELHLETWKELARIDHVWRRNGPPETRAIIAIEHENRYEKALNEELPKLLATDGDLRVLVTYLPDHKFSRRHVASLALRMEKKINEWLPANRNPEFLLMVANYKYSEDDPRDKNWFRFRWNKKSGKYVRTEISVGERTVA